MSKRSIPVQIFVDAKASVRYILDQAVHFALFYGPSIKLESRYWKRALSFSNFVFTLGPMSADLINLWSDNCAVYRGSDYLVSLGCHAREKLTAKTLKLAQQGSNGLCTGWALKFDLSA